MAPWRWDINWHPQDHQSPHFESPYLRPSPGLGASGLGGCLGPGTFCPLSHLAPPTPRTFEASHPLPRSLFLRLAATDPAPLPENLCHKEGEALIWPVSLPPGPSSPKGTLVINMGVTPCMCIKAAFIWEAPGCGEAN